MTLRGPPVVSIAVESAGQGAPPDNLTDGLVGPWDIMRLVCRSKIGDSALLTACGGLYSTTCSPRTARVGVPSISALEQDQTHMSADDFEHG